MVDLFMAKLQQYKTFNSLRGGGGAGGTMHVLRETIEEDVLYSSIMSYTIP
jgi:hypothetical protein